jgi:hypothetical protein
MDRWRMVTHFCVAPSDFCDGLTHHVALGDAAHQIDLAHLQGDARGVEKIPGMWHSGGGVAMWRGVSARSSQKNQTNPRAAEILAFLAVGRANEPGKPDARRANAHHRLTAARGL